MFVLRAFNRKRRRWCRKCSSQIE